MGGAVAKSHGARYVRATVAYDGTDFRGFQVQAEQRTVQGVLEDAVRTITQGEARVVGAGRTDSGVHALGQVVAFRTRWQSSLHDLHRALNAVLPGDVVVWSLEDADEGLVIGQIEPERQGVVFRRAGQPVLCLPRQPQGAHLQTPIGDLPLHPADRTHPRRSDRRC